MAQQVMTIKAPVDYVQGHLRTGHYELTLEGKELEDYNNMSLSDKADYITENGIIIVDSYEIDEVGDILISEIKHESN